MENVIFYCALKKDEILLFKIQNPSENCLESHSIKCLTPKVQDAKGPKVSEVKEHYVVAAAVSNCAKYMTACDSNNFLHLWKYERNSWNHQSERSLMRKCQKIIFTNSGSEIIVADRGGDVFVYSVTDSKKEGKFLLGHISLVIDIAISSEDSYLLTCDRDGKIRVSCYPNCYTIHSYCLGHEEFVSSAQSLKLSDECILTSSGDGSLKVWDFNGDILCSTNLYENETLCQSLELLKNGDDTKSALSCLLDEKQAAFAVRCVRYSPTTNVCAVAFYLVKGIAMYCVSQKKGLEFKFIKFISLECMPCDVFFDVSGSLIVLQKNSNKQFAYFKYSRKDNDICFEEMSTDTVPLFKDLEKLCGSVENLNEVQDTCDTLFKRNFDDKEDNLDVKNNASKRSKIV